MIILDTNVVSEAMKPSAEPRVIAWLDDQVVETTFVTSVTLGELLFGIEALPRGRRKSALAKALGEVLGLFEGRILPFDAEAARRYAEIAAKARSAGRPLSLADAYIAGTAAAHGFSVATRDVEPFLASGLSVINPWNEGGRVR